MEWDGGTIWRVALGIFFVLCGGGVAYALFRLGSALKRVTSILGDVNSRVVPLLTRVEATLDGFNSELDKVDQITGSVAEIVKAAEQTTTALHKAVAIPIQKFGGVAHGAREALRKIIAARRKG